MHERYDPVAAAHYAAYRPALHSLILQRVLAGAGPFDVGLDVGSGTGHSAIALAAHCGHVHGIEPSPAMLRAAAPHAKVSYHAGSAEGIPLPDGSVDVVTFAGSLSYADRAAAGAEVRRVCRNSAVVITYDFEILLGEALHRLGVEPPPRNDAYDYRIDFAGVAGFDVADAGAWRAHVAMNPDELAHLLLSDSRCLDLLAGRFAMPDPFPAVRDHLVAAGARGAEADLYYARHRLA